MNLEKYTQKSQEALLAARRLEQDYQQQAVEPIRLLLVMRQGWISVARVSAYFGFDLPVTFPYYQGGNAGQPIQNPLATQKP